MNQIPHLSLKEEDAEEIIDIFDNLFRRISYRENHKDIRFYIYQTSDGEEIAIVIERLSERIYRRGYDLYFGINSFPNTLSFEEFFKCVDKSVKRSLLFNLNLFL